MSRFEKCPYNHDDCFARSTIHSKRCMILNNTYFKDGECHFFKSCKDYYDGLKKWGYGFDYVQRKKEEEGNDD